MSFINPVSFRLGSLNIWPYRNVLLYNRFFYNKDIKKTYYISNFLLKLFDRRFYRRFDYYLSHILISKLNDGSLSYTLYMDSQFLRGVNSWFYKEFLNQFYGLLRRKKILRVNYKYPKRINFSSAKLTYISNFIFFRVYSHLNSLSSFILRSCLRLLLNIENVSKIDNLNLSLRILSDNAPSALSLGSIFVNKLKRGNSLKRIVKSTFKFWHNNKYKNILGLRIVCEGRFKRRQRAQHEIYSVGQIQSSKILGKVDYSLSTVYLKYGAASVRIWLTYK